MCARCGALDLVLWEGTMGIVQGAKEANSGLGPGRGFQGKMGALEAGSCHWLAGWDSFIVSRCG